MVCLSLETAYLRVLSLNSPVGGLLGLILDTSINAGRSKSSENNGTACLWPWTFPEVHFPLLACWFHPRTAFGPEREAPPPRQAPPYFCGWGRGKHRELPYSLRRSLGRGASGTPAACLSSWHSPEGPRRSLEILRDPDSSGKSGWGSSATGLIPTFSEHPRMLSTSRPILTLPLLQDLLLPPPHMWSHVAPAAGSIFWFLFDFLGDPTHHPLPPPPPPGPALQHPLWCSKENISWGASSPAARYWQLDWVRKSRARRVFREKAWGASAMIPWDKCETPRSAGRSNWPREKWNRDWVAVAFDLAWHIAGAYGARSVSLYLALWPWAWASWTMSTPAQVHTCAVSFPNLASVILDVLEQGWLLRILLGSWVESPSQCDSDHWVGKVLRRIQVCLISGMS